MKKPATILSGIDRKLLFYFLVASIVPLILGGMFVANIANSHSREYIRVHISDLARDLGRKISYYVNMNYQNIRLLAAAEVLKSGTQKAQQSYLEQVKDAYHYYQVISLIDLKGKVIAASKEGLLGKSIASEEWFRQAIESPAGRAVGRDAYRAEINGKLAIGFNTVIRDESGKEIMGMVSAGVRMDYIIDRVKILEQRRGNNTHVYLLNRWGQVLAGPDQEEILQPFQIFEQPTDKGLLAGETGITEYRNEQEETILSARYALNGEGDFNGWGWAIIINQPILKAFKAGYAIYRAIALIILIMAIFETLLALFLARKLSKPVVQVAAAARKISEGKWDTEEIKYTYQDEVGSLVAAFNKMMKNLKETTVSRDSLVKEMAERRQAEAALGESKERLRGIIESTSDWIWEVDANCVYTYASPKIIDLLGYTPEEVLGKTPFDFIPPPEVDRIRPEFEKIFKSEKSFVNLENVNLHKEGWAVVLESNGIPFFDSNGKLIGYRGIDRDITDRRMAREQLVRQKELFSTAIDSLPYPFYIIGITNYSIETANKAAYSNNSRQVKHCYNLIYNRNKPCEGPDHPCPMDKVVETKLPVIVEHFSKDEQGNDRISKVHAYPILNRQGKVIRIIEYIIDATMQKELEESLKIEKQRAEQADNLKSAFLANMSHEIRTPLNSIIGFTDLALSSSDLSGENREYLSKAKQSSRLLLSLINDILDLSKIEAGQLKIDNTVCSVAEIFKTVGFNAEAHIANSKKSINLRKYLPDNISINIICDPFRLEQVMNNLISNAVKFTNEGFIEYGVSLKEEDLLEFYVRDTGIGIPEEKQGAIFEPFRQVDTTTARKYGGTGLGLAIVNKLVALMGGKLNLHSIDARGSTFYFSLPYRKAAVQKRINTLEEQPVEAKSGSTILVAEDDQTNQSLIKTLLERDGYCVIVANDGRDAVSCFKTNPAIDLILMDGQMPLLDGYEATGVIRNIEIEEQRKRLPVIALTAAAMRRDEQKFFDAGCDAYLTKPLEIPLLLRTISKYIK